jgi:hypothetical protein
MRLFLVDEVGRASVKPKPWAGTPKSRRRAASAEEEDHRLPCWFGARGAVGSAPSFPTDPVGSVCSLHGRTSEILHTWRVAQGWRVYGYPCEYLVKWTHNWGQVTPMSTPCYCSVVRLIIAVAVGLSKPQGLPASLEPAELRQPHVHSDVQESRDQGGLPAFPSAHRCQSPRDAAVTVVAVQESLEHRDINYSSVCPPDLWAFEGSREPRGGWLQRFAPKEAKHEQG